MLVGGEPEGPTEAETEQSAAPPVHLDARWKRALSKVVPCVLVLK